MLTTHGCVIHNQKACRTKQLKQELGVHTCTCRMHSPGIYTAIVRARVLRRGGPVRCRWLYSQNRHPTSLLPVWCGVVVVVRTYGVRIQPTVPDAWSHTSETHSLGPSVPPPEQLRAGLALRRARRARGPIRIHCAHTWAVFRC